MIKRIATAALFVAALSVAEPRSTCAQGAGPSQLGAGTPPTFHEMFGFDFESPVSQVSQVVPAGFFSNISGRNGRGQSPTPAATVSVAEVPAEVIMPGDVIIPDSGPPVVSGGGEGLPCGTCCIPPRASCPGFFVFAEFLYLNPQNVEVPFAVQINGPITGSPPPVPLQTGPVLLVDPDYQPGGRIGGGFAVSCDASVSLTYSYFDASTESSFTIENPSVEKVLRNLAGHPLAFNAATDGLSASASSEITFELADVDFRTLVYCGDRFVVNFVLGGRFTNLEQKFNTTLFEQIADNVNTNITFSGAGPRLGFEFEKQNSCRGIFVYAKSTASFASGDFHATYNQSQTTQPDIVNTSWDAGRVVTMVDLEVGGGWQGPYRHLRISGGYLMSSWYNVVKSDDWIRAVQTNSYGDLGSNISFDGLTARAEFRW